MSKFREKTRLYKVYHIHEIGNYDKNQGYIGITRRSLAYRLGQHFNSKRQIGTILRKLGKEKIQIDELCRLPKEQALEKEYELRPKRFMGWNVKAGGDRSTVCCLICGKPLPKRKTGTICMNCRDTKFTKGHRHHNYGTGEHYRLTDPEGNSYEPEAFTAFCKEYNLTPQNLRLVAKGKRKHHKGWIAERIER